MSSRAGDSRPSARVGVLRRKGKFLVVEPLFEPGPQIVVSRDRKADVGDLVLVAAGASNRQGSRRAVISRRLGRPDVARDVITALMLHRGLRLGFDPAVDHDAREAAQAPLEVGGRRDLRELPTFTIDPASARDFDDAICAQPLDDGSWRVWVHIADVAAYVTPRSSIDREAYRRGTSVYVPGAVEPMLPGRLSNDVCSLVEGADRLVVTVEMVVAEGQRVRSSSMYRSVIRSVQRLDYERVDRIFAGAERANEPWARRYRRPGPPPRCSASAMTATGRWCLTRPSRSSASTAQGTSRFDAGRPDRVTPPDRAADDRRQ